MRLRKFGDPELNVPCRLVDDIASQVEPHLFGMTWVMDEHAGIGLAANQVGIPYAFFIAYDGSDVKTYINPAITWRGKAKFTREGCLSGNSKMHTVKRPNVVKVEYTGLDGKIYREEKKGYDAVLFCHEVDHLNGVTLQDRLRKK